MHDRQDGSAQGRFAGARTNHPAAPTRTIESQEISRMSEAA